MKRSQGPILVLFARRPRLGAVKTRLAAAIGAENALALYTAFLRDSIDLMRRASPRGIRPAIAWAEPADNGAAPSGGSGPDRGAAPNGSTDFGEAAKAPNAPRRDRSAERDAIVPPTQEPSMEAHLGGFEIIEQQGDHLGQRMANCFAFLLARGHDRVVIIGSDTPSLPLDNIYQAFDLLQGRDVVLGPARDGGYYLIGARCVIPEIFRGISWGTNQVLKETLVILKILGLPRVLLPECQDVDTVEDLEALRAQLAGLSATDPTARPTRTALDEVHTSS